MGTTLMIRLVLLLLFSFGILTVSAQFCDSLIVSNGSDYYQQDRSLGKVFHKPITAEMWVDKVGEYVYFNILFKDSLTGSVLNKGYGDNLISFHFIGDKTINYSYVEGSDKRVISIPLNKNPDGDVKIVMDADDSSELLTSYIPFLDAIYLDTLSYISFNKRNHPGDTKQRFPESLLIVLKKPAAIRLRASTMCIFKAIQ